MAYAPNFDKYLKRGLDEKAPQYAWKAGWGPDRERWKVDVAGVPKKSGALILIEVELKKDNPVENVVKVWRWASDAKYKRRILFLHVFSANFVKMRHFASPPKKVKQYNRAVFVGERMQRDRNHKITYTVMKMKLRPSMVRGKIIKEGGGAMHRAARGLAMEIAKSLHSK
jgi:hypothetical protein